MSTPGPWVQPAAQPAGAPVAQQATAPQSPAPQAATQQQGQQNQPAPRSATQPRPGSDRSRWTTPRVLRLARAGAAAAVLLTGVAATGTFSTDGLNVTPDVKARQWVSAERAGVEIAHADLRAAERVDEDTTSARDGYDEAVTQVTHDLIGLGATGEDAASVAREWSTFLLGAERALEPGAPASDYERASLAARTAAEATDAVAQQHAQALRTGSRSVLTGTVGTASLLGLIALMVWLALRTRRIINVPLLIGTAITAGLTYLSINPSAVPVTYDQRLGETTATATALQEVYQMRQAQHAVAMGLPDRWEAQAALTQTALVELRVPELRAAWDEVFTAYEQAEEQGGSSREVMGRALSSSQQSYETLESGLQERLDDQLGDAASAVGGPAFTTSGVALLLGLVGAGLAWRGVSQRLKEYR